MKASPRKLNLNAPPEYPFANIGFQGRSIDQIAPAPMKVLRRVLEGELPFPLFIAGPAGVGKTCAALSFLDYCQSRRYITACDFISNTNAAMFGNYQSGGYTISSSGYRSDWQDAGITCMDELGGRDKVSDSHYNTIKNAIDDREGKASIWISNLTLSELERIYDDRIASRLAAGTAINMTGKDRRINKK